MKAEIAKGLLRAAKALSPEERTPVQSSIERPRNGGVRVVSSPPPPVIVPKAPPAPIEQHADATSDAEFTGHGSSSNVGSMKGGKYGRDQHSDRKVASHDYPDASGRGQDAVVSEKTEDAPASNTAAVRDSHAAQAQTEAPASAEAATDALPAGEPIGNHPHLASETSHPKHHHKGSERAPEQESKKANGKVNGAHSRADR